MKKLIAPLFVIVLLLPNMVFAAWWNPSTWFNGWSFSAGATHSSYQDLLKAKHDKASAIGVYLNSETR